MSRRKYECCYPNQMMVEPCCNNKCDSICSFPTLVILILIVLQFGGAGILGLGGDEEGVACGGGIFSNGILFIIALFFLSCRCNLF